MKVGTLLLILHDVTEKLVGMGLLSSSTGEFTGPTLEQDLMIVSMVEDCAKARGISFQSDVDKIIRAMPLVLSLLK